MNVKKKKCLCEWVKDTYIKCFECSASVAKNYIKKSVHLPFQGDWGKHPWWYQRQVAIFLPLVWQLQLRLTAQVKKGNTTKQKRQIQLSIYLLVKSYPLKLICIAKNHMTLSSDSLPQSVCVLRLQWQSTIPFGFPTVFKSRYLAAEGKWQTLISHLRWTSF